MKVNGYLIVKASGAMRVNKRWTSLAPDEVAFPISVIIPDTWGKYHNDRRIEIQMPNPPDPVVVVSEPKLPEPKESE